MTWVRTTIGDVVELFDNMRVPLNSRQRAERQGPFPYYGAQGIIDHIDDYLFDGRYLLVPEDGENLNSRKLPIAFFAKGRFWVNNHAHILRGRRGVADDEFLKHLLNSMNISGFVTGAAQPKLSQDSLKRIEISLPPFDLQRKIADILSAYDHLIEVNTRRIAALEEMARRLFEEWITRVDTVALPPGWRAASLSDLVEDRRDAVLPSSLPPETPYVGLEHMPRRSIALCEYGRADAVTSTKLRFEKGDILFGKIRPYFHKVVIAPFAGISSSDAIVMRPRNAAAGALAACLTSSDHFVAHAVQTSNGTKMPRASWNVMQKYEVAIPPPDVLSRFCEIVLPAHQLCAHFAAANRQLRATRDLLLPKLISGEVDVEHASRSTVVGERAAAE